MPLNISDNNAKSRASIGPGVLYIGAAGATPTVSAGLITEDGATFEVGGEMVDVLQGNPRLIEFSFFQTQSATLGITSIEWELDRLASAIGAGNTVVTGTEETLSFGGEPCVQEYAIELQHRKCTAVHTVNIRLWKANSADGGVSVPMNAGQVHQFPMRWRGLRADTNWAGDALPADEQLFQVAIELGLP